MNQRDIQNKNCFKYGNERTDEQPIAEDEPNAKIMDAVKILMKEIGDDPEREGLVRTPLRVARAYNEWFGGYGKKPEEALNRTFPSEGYEDMVIIKDIEYWSHCEHHITPFFGKVHIAVIYGDRIAGLDKFPKLVDIYARRLQTQEVMTKQIGDAIKKVLTPKGVYVLIEGKHLCVGSRETKQDGVSFITTYRDGLFKDKQELETKFLSLIKKQ